MKLEKDTEKEVRKIYEIWLNSYLNGDVETYDYYLDDAYHFIGSTNNEEFLNRKDTTEFFKLTAEQLAGKMDLRNDNIALEYFNELVFITHSCDTWFLNDSEWVYYGRFRCSSVLKEKEEGWRFIYQHFSTTDSKTDEGETIGFDKVNAENQELREAIKRRTVELELKNRELEIEAALERVRSASMAMHKSDELIQVVRILDKEILGLGIEVEGTQIITDFTDQEKGLNDWFAREGFDYLEKFHVPDIKHPITEKIIKAISKGSNFYTETLSNADKDDYFKLLFKYSDFKKLPIKRQGPVYKAPGWVRAVVVSENSILIFQRFNLKEFSKDEEEIFKRFGKVFEQAYTRFLDLQKAEAQVREAQIEAALERVRSSAMAMHSSEDLHHVAEELRKQIGQLDYKDLETCAIHLYDESPDYFVSWAASLSPNSASDILHSQNYFPKKGVSVLEELIARYQSDDKDYMVVNEGEKMVGFLEMLKKIAPETFKVVKNTYKDFAPKDYRSFWTVSDFKGGSLLMTTLAKPDASTHKLLRRFADVFGLAYRRFADLKKAEAQAREAQIEAALERIRSRSLAMHKSEELVDVATVLHYELRSLNVREFSETSIVVHDEPNQKLIVWGARSESGSIEKSVFPLLGDPILQKLYDTWREQKDFFTLKIEGTALRKHMDFVFPKTSRTAQEHKAIKSMPDPTFFHCAYFCMGYLELMADKDLSEDSVSILVRFAKVFDQAYTRFLDLQKAEAQAREAQIEASLERVRSQAMAMRHSDDLVKSTQIVFDELENLNFSIERSGIGIFDGETKDCELWTTVINKDGEKHLARGVTSLTVHPLFVSTFDSWLSQTPYSYTLEGQELQDYYDLVSKSEFALSDEIAEKSTSLPKEYYHYSPFSAGGVYFFSETEPTAEDKQIIRRLAEVFDLTYTRFLDLQKAEAQAKETQIQLALERVRARTMAMQKSDELSETAAVLFQQFIELGYENERINIGIIKKDQRFIEFWSTEQGGNAISQVFKGSIDEPTSIKKFYEGWVNKEDSIVVGLQGEELKNWMSYVIDVLKIPTQENLISDHRYHSVAYFSNGLLIITNPKPLLPETFQILKRFAKVFEQTYTRFLDLQKAEAQARESQIEAALERVRSKAMAMHNTGDLANANGVVFNELNSLGISPLRSGIGLIEEETRQGTMYATVLSDQGNNLLLLGKISLTNNPVLESIFDHWTKKQIYYPKLNGQELKQYYDLILASYGDLPKPKFSKNEVQYGYFLPFKHGSVYAWTQEPFSEDELKTIQRFVSVIDLTYNRYFDLQRAEAQAREAQIEAALERIRSHSMAMHKTSELSEVIIVLFKQFKLLNLVVDTCYIDIFDQNNQGFNFWIGAGTAIYPKQVTLPYFDHPIHQLNRDARQNGIDFFTFDEDKKSKEKYFEHFYPNAKGIDVPEERKQHIANGKGITGAAALGKYSGITMFNYQKIIYSNEENDILMRVNKVFQQTYTRFLDLQKAEAQAREAQIEAALERVRSASMAMHSSDELEKVVEVTFRQLQSLMLPIDGCQLITFEDQSKNFHFWSATPEMIYPTRLNIPYFDHPIFLKFWEARDRGDTFTSIDLTRKETLDFYNHLYDKTNLGIAVTNERWEKIQSIEHGFKTSWGIQKNTGLWVFNFSNHQFTEEENSLIDRFAKVFEQTYTRFLDLQKAEAREKEAIKQASLDRVRAEIASMRDAKDLERITPLVWKELRALGVPFFRCGVMLVNEKDSILDFYLSNPEGKALAALHLDFDNSDISRNGVDHWRKKETYIEHWNQEEFLTFMKSLLDQGQISNAATYQGGEKPPEALTLQFVPFTQGMVYVGSESDLSKEELDLVKALGRSLSVAYARYEDFTKLDLAKAKAEKALTELKSAQEQLVQQEKLASLGQLTAGIAHEIKNPLNFVNNFSDLSRELIEEVFEELENITDSEAKEEIMAILNDVKSNLIKVHEHGTRANGIVSSMLQHSRASGSKREPKAFNPLVKEFVNLSFHGMRAGKAPINVDIALQLDPKVVDVTLISEDFSRVILNLCNNAFDAMRDKLKTEDGRQKTEAYLPKLSVKTSLQKDKVLLSITDNGGGIPAEIKDKILQPFFTTKKGTEGTGLGLSITNDIVKAHGGELKIITHQEKGTSFNIELPIK